MARSTTEAEYQPLALTAVELLGFARSLLKLGFPLSQRPIVCLASNLIFHARTKHEIHYHYSREQSSKSECAN